MDKLKKSEVTAVFDAIMSLKNVDECYSFFEDLCTAKEIEAMAQRFAVAKLLRSKTVYTEIVQKTGASTATISRVNRSLTYGKDGYAMVFERLFGGNV